MKKKETEELEREAKEREEALRKRSEQYHRTVLSRPADSDGSEAAKHAEVAAATGQGASYTKSRPPELTIPKTPNFVTSLPQTLPDETMADIEKEMADLIEVSTHQTGIACHMLLCPVHVTVPRQPLLLFFLQGALSLGESPAPSAGQTKHVPDAQVSREETKDAPGAPHGEAAMALAKNGAMPSCASEEGMREREGETAVGQGEVRASSTPEPWHCMLSLWPMFWAVCSTLRCASLAALLAQW